MADDIDTHAAEAERMRAEFVTALETRDRLMLDRGRAESAAEIERLRAVEKDHETFVQFLRVELPDASPCDDLQEISSCVTEMVRSHKRRWDAMERMRNDSLRLARGLGVCADRSLATHTVDAHAEAMMAACVEAMERLRASEAQAVADADALADGIVTQRHLEVTRRKWSHDPMMSEEAVAAFDARNTAQARMESALARAADRRAKKEASDAER